MKTKKVPLYEAVRPTCHPSQAGAVGKNMHALGDNIEENAPDLAIVVVCDTTSTDAEYWQSVVECLNLIRSINLDEFDLAIHRIAELALGDN